jgi:hypothetical protein
MFLKFIPALFCLFVISDVVMAKPGDVLVEQEGVLHTAKVCVLSNPRSAGSPLTVYCNGELALQVESFEGGFFNNGQKALDEVRAFSIAISLMFEREFKIFNGPAIASPVDLVTFSSLTFIK